MARMQVARKPHEEACICSHSAHKKDNEFVPVRQMMFSVFSFSQTCVYAQYEYACKIYVVVL